MTDAISGKFDYASLKRTLKKEGVQGKDMQSALRQVAADNHIDNIKDLDKTKEITIDKSVFSSNESATDPFNIGQIQPFGNLFSFNKDAEIQPAVMNIAIKGDYDVKNMPEVFNADDYEVVDYDDFYTFGAASNDENDEEASKDGKKSSNDLFIKASELQPYAITNPINMFTQTPDMFNKLPDALKMNPQILMTDAMFGTPSQSDKNYSTDANTDREDLLEGAMSMEFDMSNDAFNA